MLSIFQNSFLQISLSVLPILPLPDDPVSEETQVQPSHKTSGEFMLVWGYCVKGTTAPQFSILNWMENLGQS